MNEMQCGARVGAQAYDIAGIRRDFRLKQHNMKHRKQSAKNFLIVIPAKAGIQKIKYPGPRFHGGDEKNQAPVQRADNAYAG
ncbi:MAG: hypothetical protein KGL98_09395 [Gammaproteobacteria bacterium]|nr:hypothetical protein [Gammaproteobacteria bacterium]